MPATGAGCAGPVPAGVYSCAQPDLIEGRPVQQTDCDAARATESTPTTAFALLCVTS